MLGGLANVAKEYATKRYRANLINWGMLPLLLKEDADFKVGDYIYVPDIKKALDTDMKEIKAYVVDIEKNICYDIKMTISEMTDVEKDIIRAGCLINYNKNRLEKKAK